MRSPRNAATGGDDAPGSTNRIGKTNPRSVKQKAKSDKSARLGSLGNALPPELWSELARRVQTDRGNHE
jgi:hypothetical protein